MEEKFIKEAINQAKKGYNENEIPVGCVIAENNKIIARGFNKSNKLKNPLKHAELITIEKACHRKKSKYLTNCTIYITSEPCVMCIGAIAQAKIKKVVFLLENEKFGFSKNLNNSKIIMNHKIEITKRECGEEILVMLKSFFKNKR